MTESSPPYGRREPFPGDASDDASPDVGGSSLLLGFTNLLLRERRIILVCALLGVLGGVTLAILSARQGHVAESKFVSRDSQGSSAAGRLGAALGLSGGGSFLGGESPAFYLALMHSRALLEDLALYEYRFRAEDGERPRLVEGTVYDIFRLGDPDSAAARRQAVKELSRRIAGEYDNATGVMRIRTRAEWPRMALALNHNLLELINQFNVDRRREQARLEREYLEARMAEAGAELRQAEGQLERFLERNRKWKDSPELSIAHDRLVRGVELRQQLYVQLAQSYEGMRLAEAKTTPVLSVLEPPALIEPRTRQEEINRVILLGVLGLGLGILLALLRDYVRRQPERSPEQYREFRRLYSSVRDGGIIPRFTVPRRNGSVALPVEEHAPRREREPTAVGAEEVGQNAGTET